MSHVSTCAILLNGDFADMIEITRQVLGKMGAAVRRRSVTGPKEKVMLQISFDEFHQEVVVDRNGELTERIPVTKIANIVEAVPKLKDEIQLWMLIAFAIVLALGLYKVYTIFNSPAPGPGTKAQHAQLENLVIDFLKHTDKKDISSKDLFDLLIQEDDLIGNNHKNFNHNRLNQLLQQLYYTYEVSSLSELITIIHQPERGTSKENDA